MSTRLDTCLVVSLVLLGCAASSGCLEAASPSCTRSSDCDPGSFCRMGRCVPAAPAARFGSDTRTTTSRGADASTQGGGTEQSPSPSTSEPERAESNGNATTGSTAGNPSAPSASDATSSTGESCPSGRAPQAGDLVINEILVDVPSDTRGDVNGDGTRDAVDDEFVELVNVSGATLDLHGLSLVESGDAVAEIDRGCLASNRALVVFGGYEGSGRPSLPKASTRVASGSLGLGNGGGRLTVRNRVGARIARVEWSEAPAESLTLDPQLRGDAYRPHSKMVPGTLTTPGRCADGSPLVSGCSVPMSSDAGASQRDAGRDAGTGGG